jgi:hypothetical protein
MSDPALDAVVTHVRVEILFRELEDLVPQLEEASIAWRKCQPLDAQTARAVSAFHGQPSILRPYYYSSVCFSFGLRR